MTKLEQLIQELCPNGVEYKTLGEIAEYSKTRIPISTITVDEYIGVENLLQNKAGRTTASSLPLNTDVAIAFECDDILIGNIRPYLRKIWLADCNGGTNGDVLTVHINDKAVVMPRFLYYVLSSEKFFFYDIQYSKGAKMPRGDKAAVMRYICPIPPLEVQAEIVRILDKFTELTTELTTELANRKKQYAYYREKLLNDYKHKAEIVKVSDLGSWQGGKTPSMQEKRFWENGTIPWISSKDVKTSELMDTEDHITEYALSESSMKLFPEETVVIVTRSGILKHTFPVAFVPFRTTVNQDIKVLSVKEGVLPRYAFHVLQAYGEDIRTKAKKQGGTVDSLEFQKVLDYEIPLPDYETQKRLVNVLDNFEAICSDLNIGLPAEIEARKKQYEYYRDKLLIFKKVNNN